MQIRNPKLGMLLKQRRLHSRMSVKDVSKSLYKKYGIEVSPKTIYGWESNDSRPPLDTFFAVCYLYCIHDLTKELQECTDPPTPPNTFRITHKEKLFVENYRKHPELQPGINKLLGIDIEPCLGPPALSPEEQEEERRYMERRKKKVAKKLPSVSTKSTYRDIPGRYGTGINFSLLHKNDISNGKTTVSILDKRFSIWRNDN